MKKIYLIGVALALALSGCAKKPENIAAVSVGDGVYANLSCKNISANLVKYKQNLENLSAEQRSAASGDAWGVFLLGLPVSSMGGADKEASISVTKGHIQQLEAEQQRRCSK